MIRFLMALTFFVAASAHAEEETDFFDFKSPSIPLEGRSAWGAGTGSGQGYVSWKKWSNNKRAFEYRLGLYDSGRNLTDSSEFSNQITVTPAFVAQFNLVQSGRYVLIQWIASLNGSFADGYDGFFNYSRRVYSYGGGLFTGPGVEIFLPVFHNLSLSGSTGVNIKYTYYTSEGSTVGQNHWQVNTTENPLTLWSLGLNLYY